MSAFERNPLRKKYEEAGRTLGVRLVGSRRLPLSGQNRRVRFAVDADLARAKLFEHRDTRQQRRWAKRKGYRIAAIGPEEV